MNQPVSMTTGHAPAPSRAAVMARLRCYLDAFGVGARNAAIGWAFCPEAEIVALRLGDRPSTDCHGRTWRRPAAAERTLTDVARG